MRITIEVETDDPRENSREWKLTVRKDGETLAEKPLGAGPWPHAVKNELGNLVSAGLLPRGC